MSTNTRIKSLNKKHNQLEEKLHDAYVHHLPTAKIKELKMKKLLIKDQIAALNDNEEAEAA